MILKRALFFFSKIVITLLLAMFFAFASAASDTFTVKLIVGSDTTPPTVPVNFSVSAVSTSQINLSWDASSDNVGVGGYQVFRNSTQIATTTLTTYSDTSLTSNTLYNYYVTAFDTAFNYATSTAIISTSTYATVATSSLSLVSSFSGGIKFNFTDIEILNLKYETTRHSVSLSFDTNVYTQIALRWGRTIDYTGGYIASDVFKKTHSTNIDSLEAGTVYELELQLVDRTGRYTLSKHIQITTKSIPDKNPPPNVINLTAWRTDDTVHVSWVNPEVKDFSHVRVLSSDYFYPTHMFDGWLVYEGRTTSIRDDRIIPAGGARYYTVFSYDNSGNISSGAVTYVVRGDGNIAISPKTIQSIHIATTSSNILPMLLFADIGFTQNGYQKFAENKQIILYGNKNTIIFIPYDLLPEHLKTIVMTISYPIEGAEPFSFLLRINPGKTGYEARIRTPIEAGQYKTVLSLFDYKTQQLYKTEGLIVIKESSDVVSGDKKRVFNIIDNIKQNKLIYLLFVLVIFIIFVIQILYKKYNMRISSFFKKSD